MKNLLDTIMVYRKNLNEFRFLLVECLAILRSHPEYKEISDRVERALESIKIVEK
jgi:hypothetical protein